MTTEQLTAAVAPKANTATVTAGLMLKADKASPTFTGEATAANLTVNGNLTMTQAGTSLTEKKLQAAPSSNLELSGVVTASGFVNLTGGANIVNPDFSGTITGLSKANVGLANVNDTSDAAKPLSTAVTTALAGKAPVFDRNWPPVDQRPGAWKRDSECKRLCVRRHRCGTVSEG